MAIEWVRAGTNAAREVIPGQNVDANTSEEIRNRIGTRAETLMHEAVRTNRDEQLKHLEEKTVMLEKYSAEAGKLAADNLNSVLRTMIVQAATAYEVLVRQLHDGARLEKPASFAPIDPALPPLFITRDKMR